MIKTKKFCMIDIETTGKKAGCKVLTIGAKTFTRYGMSGSIREEFYMRADPWLYPENFTSDPDTMKWWFEQDKDIRDEAFGGNDTPYMMAGHFDAYLRDVAPDYIFCKGASFDFPITNFLLEHYKFPPLPYRGLRCMRGLLTLSGTTPVNNPSAHNALYDAIEQAENVMNALNDIPGAWDRYDAE
jgi:DNA polymerase III epsilon subunit-like protein